MIDQHSLLKKIRAKNEHKDLAIKKMLKQEDFQKELAKFYAGKKRKAEAATSNAKRARKPRRGA